jgi:hypothetical protein
MYDETVSTGLQQESKTRRKCSLLYLMMGRTKGASIYDKQTVRRDRENDTSIVRETTRHKVQGAKNRRSERVKTGGLAHRGQDEGTRCKTKKTVSVMLRYINPCYRIRSPDAGERGKGKRMVEGKAGRDFWGKRKVGGWVPVDSPRSSGWKTSGDTMCQYR